MDVLLLSCGTGGGHDAAARAIAEELRRRGHSSQMLNPYTLKSERLAGRIDRLYVGSVQKTPSLFGVVYRLGQLCRKLPFRSPVYHANRLMVPALEEYLEHNNFDAVITTHIFPAMMLTALRRSGVETPVTIHIATDCVCIPFTEDCECDAYVVPAPDLVDAFAGCGLPLEKIYPLGIPVSAAFSLRASRESERARLGLELDTKYVLVSGGSMGGGSIGRAVAALSEAASRRDDTQLLVVCGSNAELFDELHRAAMPNVTPLGYTKDMAAYMRAADLFVTKPGGLSSTEAAVCGAALIHTAAIPGCETYNAEYFSSHGMSRLCDATPEALSAALDLLDDSAARERMRERQRRFVNPYAAADICALAERLSGGRVRAAV